MVGNVLEVSSKCLILCFVQFMKLVKVETSMQNFSRQLKDSKKCHLSNSVMCPAWMELIHTSACDSYDFIGYLSTFY